MTGEISFDHYYAYDELTSILNALAVRRPDLMSLESIGKSYEGRDIWLATVTNSATGPAADKPAFWIDGNIHATEVSAASAAIYFLNKLLSDYGTHADITRCLDTRAYYIVPRVNPDGAELFFSDKPKFLRSSTRPYPYDEEPIDGLKREDVDGDGRLLSMRIPDPNGAWKVSEEEPRLLVRRDPTEIGGIYYRILPEGMLENWDGVTLRVQPNKEGLDLNRNFPAHWRQEGEQFGAGPFPASEPEVHACVSFIASHPNITSGVTFHTFSGVLLRPYGTQADEAMPAEDLWTYHAIGKKGTEITGYPAISVFHDFKYHPKEVITGVFDDWLYDHMGLYGWTVEIWSPQRMAGLTNFGPHKPDGGFKFIDWSRDHPFEDDLKMLRWSDEQLDGRGYVDWYPFEHPQLGNLEIGGWDPIFAFRNPPPSFIESEISKFPEWLVWHALISPKLEIERFEATPLECAGPSAPDAFPLECAGPSALDAFPLECAGPSALDAFPLECAGPSALDALPLECAGPSALDALPLEGAAPSAPSETPDAAPTERTPSGGRCAYLLRLVVDNTGWLPTYITKKALERKVVRGVVAELDMPVGVELTTGQRRIEAGQLEGRAYKAAAAFGWTADPTQERTKFEWVVRGRPGEMVKVVVKHERAGTVRAQVTLG